MVEIQVQWMWCRVSLHGTRMHTQRITTRPVQPSIMLDGSGVIWVLGSYAASSKVNDSPFGAAFKVTRVIAAAGEVSCKDSLGVLPGIPESASLLEKSDATEMSRLFAESKACRVTGAE